MSKTYLITGGAGFIGSHLTDLILGQGHRVLVIDDLSTGARSNIAQHLNRRDFQFAHTSITNAVVLDRMVSEADHVIHLAAAVGVNLVVERPVHTIETNIMGTEAVLQACARYNRPVLLASTSEVYGKGQSIPFSEDDDVLLGATAKSRWGYAASKMVDEFLGLAYVRERGLSVVPFRLFNTVGPRQTGRYGMVIPAFVGKALAGEPIQVFGDGTQQRCFCHVFDVVRAIAGLAESADAIGKVVNIGGIEEVTMMALAERVKKMTESASPIVTVPYEEAYAPGFEDMMRRVPDISRIGGLIGWKPERSLDDILRDVIEHERNKA